MKIVKDTLRRLVFGGQAEGANFVMGLFREGLDPKRIADMIGADEADVYRLLSAAREDERMARC